MADHEEDKLASYRLSRHRADVAASIVGGSVGSDFLDRAADAALHGAGFGSSLGRTFSRWKGPGLTMVEGIPGTSAGPIIIWNAETRQKVGVIGDRKNQFRPYVHFSPDGKLMAVREVKEYPNEELLIFDFATLAKKTSVEIQTPMTTRPTACFSPDARLVAFNARENGAHCMKVWDLDMRHEPTTMQGGEWPSFFFPDGKTLVTYQYELGGGLKLFDAQTGEQRLSWLQDEVAEVVSPGGKFAAGRNFGKLRGLIGPYSGPLKIWDIATHRKIATLEHELNMTFVSDSILATAYDDPDSREVHLMLWHLPDGKQATDLTFTWGPLLSKDAAFRAIPGGQYLAVTTSRPLSIWGKTIDGPPELRIIDTSTSQELGRLVDWLDIERIYKFEISHDGRTVATESRERTVDLKVGVWDIPPSKSIKWIIGLLAVPTFLTALTVWRWWPRKTRGSQRATEAAGTS